MTDETDRRQPGRDGKTNQQESFEDYYDHNRILHTAAVAMIHQAHQTAIRFSLLFNLLLSVFSEALW